MKIERLDHLVLTVRDVERTVAFYVTVLGMEAISFATDRRALRFGEQKINLHPAAKPFPPHAAQPTPGSADFCLITSTPLSDVITHLASVGVAVEAGPVERTGATEPLDSIYFRDPDGNLIEVANEA